jgi:hypothetical protein
MNDDSDQFSENVNQFFVARAFLARKETIAIHQAGRG